MSVRVLHLVDGSMVVEGRIVPTPDEQLLQRCTVLMDTLAEARDEMIAAILLGDVEVACRAARKLSSCGWLFKEAADKRRDAE